MTPNHVAKLQPLVSLPSEFDELPLDRLSKISIQTRWDARKKLHQKYMMRFQSEYLQELQKRTKNFVSSRNLILGDVVLRLNDKTRQNPWPLARVEEPIVSKDGKVRSCWVRLPIDLNKPASKKKTNRRLALLGVVLKIFVCENNAS